MFNLSFLNSSALILSLAALVPLLIYLFAKKRPPRIIFSSIRFIQLSQKKQKKKMNLKNLLLLLIRMLIILFTVLAISRPAVKVESLKSSSRHPRTAAAIIIDNSYSMDYVVDTQSELDKALAIAAEIGEMLTEDDVSTLYTLEKAWNQQNSSLNFGSFSSESLRSIKITPLPADAAEVILMAENDLQKSDIPNREIYFITDLQEQEIPDDLQTTLFVIPSSELEDRLNLSVEDARPGTNFIERGIERQIDFVVVNNGSRLAEDAICSLTLDGRTVSEKVTDLQPGERQQNSFLISLERPGWHYGYVNVRDERLIYDNRYYFAFFYDHQPEIGIITSKRELPVTLKTLLEIYSGGSGKIDLIHENLSLEKVKDYDNLVVWAYDDWDGQLQFVLSNLHQQGKKILFLADNDLSERARSYLAEEFDLQFHQLLDRQETKKITQINKYHPAAVRLDAQRPAEVRSLWLSSTNSNVILEAETYPLAVENEGNIIWLFDSSDLRSSFLVDANYPVLAYNSLMFTASSGSGRRQFTSGMLYRPEAEQLMLPDGNRLSTGSRKIKLSEQGIYLEGKDKTPLAVNLEYSESRFEELSLTESPQLVLCDQNWQEAIFQARYGFELWKYLMVLVLILFAMEIIIIKSEENKG